jgi:leucyl-tRNA synthetase
MEFVNMLMRYDAAQDPHRDVTREAHDALLLLLAPMAPHIAAELWERHHPGEPSVHAQSWPLFDAELATEETVTLVIQVNGKVRDRVAVDPAIDAATAESLALASERVREALAGAEVRRIVVRPPNLVNVVV